MRGGRLEVADDFGDAQQLGTRGEVRAFQVAHVEPQPELTATGEELHVAAEAQTTHVLDMHGRVCALPGAFFAQLGHSRSVPLRAPLVPLPFPSGIVVATLACGMRHSAVSFFF